MATADTDSTAPAGADADAAADSAAEQAGDSYEIIRRRLLSAGQALRGKTDALNEARKEVFGASELAVVANERVRTENNCVPRDIVTVRGALLFAYNVFIGLKSETATSDVFALHRFAPADDGGYDCDALELSQAAPWLADAVFVKDFQNLYRYYREARILQLVKSDTRLLAVFQIGASHTDIKVFRWRIEADGSLAYIDDRGDRDYVYPPPYDFEWVEIGREHQVRGTHPHANIDDVLFVDTMAGDLTIKIEDNTSTGEGIYTEPVDEKNQTLDDAQIRYARRGSLLLLAVLPFRERDTRYLVYSERTQKVLRIDAIGQACLSLPEDHGILFPGGYVLESGEYKVFDGDNDDLEFKRELKSPNGEDVLYVFHRRRDGHYALLSYNLIRKQVSTPIHCHGYSLFDDGRLVVFRALSDEPTRVHPMQVWQTPFTSAEYAASQPAGDSFLSKVGNADLVRGISDAYSLIRLTDSDRPNRQTYEDIIATAARVVDSYYWLDHDEVGDLKGDVAHIRRTAELIVDEFEKVELLRKQAVSAIADTGDKLEAVVRELAPDQWREVGPFVDALAALRTLRGHIISLREMRYIDTERLDEMEAACVEHFDRISRDCARYLQRDEAFKPLVTELEATLGKVDAVTKVAEIVPLREAVENTSAGLDLLAEVVGNLQIEDATQRTAILESISETFAQVNRVRATLDSRYRTLMVAEGRAEFGAQFRLLGQSITSALAVCDSPERCDEELARVTVQLEELEARFSEFDEFAADLAAKREEIYDAFSGRKQTLLDERQRRVQNLVKAADRILEGVGRRARALTTTDEINAYFAADAMVMKLRQLGEQLGELGDSVKSDELLSRLKSARQDALRALRDKLDLYETGDGGANLIKLGRHRFSVNTQPLELTMVRRDDGMALHLGGTDFYERIDDPEFAATKRFWDQDLVSESKAVYRGEYLAACVLFAAERGDSLAGEPATAAADAADAGDSAGGEGEGEGGPGAAGAGRGEALSIQALHDATRSDGGLLAVVRRFAQARYDEGYERGIHDADAAALLERLLAMRETAGLLRFAAVPRSLALLFWAVRGATPAGRAWHRRALGLARLREAFGQSDAEAALAEELAAAIEAFTTTTGTATGTTAGPTAGIAQVLGQARGLLTGDGGLDSADFALAGEYLALELMAPSPRFVLAASAESLRERFLRDLDLRGVRGAFEEDLKPTTSDSGDASDYSGAGDGPDSAHRLRLAYAWVAAFSRSRADRAATPGDALEAATALVTAAQAEATGASERGIGAGRIDLRIDREVSSALTEAEVKGLLGRHGRIVDRTMRLRLDEFLARLSAFARYQVPAYRSYRSARSAILERERERLRLGEFAPQVMSAFVRNRLIDEVYLPLVGDNLAKQMGSVGADKRTDLMGMLLLISPPGYGKTTLMEYIASRLGLVFVKVNGPSLGHDVHSLDPAEASSATARQEVEKVNLAFEMGNNVMLYLDDIQHTHPEFLQKFISLCDGQRKIEGVWQGRTRTYDLRGKKFCVVMAGNPYTESGETFRIPDMLSNRADIYNLGDVLGGKEDLFALSYIENSLTSNPTLAPLATREPGDLYKLLRVAQGDTIAASELAHDYSAVERTDIVNVLRHLSRCQDVLLKVNREYIESAAQDDRYRTRPPFKLQGSYRNMNKLAEKVVPAMTADEVERLIDDHYVGEAQTLTTEAEQNLLMLAELRDRMGADEAARWREIEGEFQRLRRMGGDEDDPVTRVTGTLSGLSEQLSGIREALGADVNRDLAPTIDAVATRLGEIGPLIAGAVERSAAPAASAEAIAAPAWAESLVTSLARLETALAAVARPVLDVRVENRAPEGIDELLAQQVAIIERTLIPVVRAATSHLGETQALERKLGTLLTRLGDAGATLSAPPPTPPPTPPPIPSTTPPPTPPTTRSTAQSGTPRDPSTDTPNPDQ